MYRMRILKPLNQHLEPRQAINTVPDVLSTAIPTAPPLPSSSTIGPPNINQNSDHETTIIAVTAASLAIIVGFVLAFYILRHFHEKKRSSEKPSISFFRLLWSKSSSDSKNYQIPGANEQLEPIARNNEREGIDSTSLEMASRFERTDRAPSCRSVITLPSYIQTARQNEQVLGREGERGGIDVVVEFPDTAEEEEQRREDEMEALYQVRLARRRENEAREQRRLRREARERGEPPTERDTEETGRLRDEETPGQTIEELRAEHSRIKRQRQRAVSVVSYAEIGVARHDGTRLNSVSQEIEQTDLLDDAASISRSNRPHINDRTASIRSFNTMHSDLHLSVSPRTSTPGNILPISPHTQHDLGLSRPEQSAGTSNPSPLFTTHVWDGPGSKARRFSRNGERSASINFSISSAAERNSPIPSSIPPEYRNVPLASPMNSTEFPPDYSCPEPEDDTQTLNLRSKSSTAPGPTENSSGSSSNTVQGPHDSNEPVSNSQSGSPTNRIHDRRSSCRGKLPPLANLKLRPLPSIEINPASPPPPSEHRM